MASFEESQFTTIQNKKESQIRKYRKKLRQIEHLQSLRRPLTDEEQQKLVKAVAKAISPAKIKVLLKTAIRNELQKLLSQLTHECGVFNNEVEEEEEAEDNSDDDITDTNHQSKAIPQNFQTDEMKRTREPSVELPEEQNRHNEDKRIKTESRAASPFSNNAGPSSQDSTSTRTNQQSQVQVSKKKFKNLRNYKIVCRQLEGHSDIVWCVSADREYVISGSRDTTARVWDVKTGEEVCSLRGHTNSVNGVGLLSKEKGHELLRQEEDYSDITKRKLAVTASGDCSLRVWLLPQGVLLKSIYTFNDIMCLTLMSDSLRAITGTDGGKIEMWDLSTGKALQSVIAYENSVSCIESSGPQVCSGSVDGIIKIWLLQDNALSVIYTLDPNMDISNPRNSLKHLKSLCLKEGRIFMGDEGVNLKVLTWKKGEIRQIKNHLSKYGCTDSVHNYEELLVSSSYNLDTGLGCVHLRLLPEGEYLCSLPEVFTRVLTLALIEGDEVCDYRIVTGGMQLAVWDLIDPSQKTALKRYKEEDDCKIYNAGFRSEINSEAVVSSSEDEESDDDEEIKEDLMEEKIGSAQSSEIPVRKESNWSWCNVL